MSKLSNAEINRILAEFAENNPDKELTENQIQTTIDLFNRLMNENVNKNKNLAEQESFVTDIAIGLTIKPKGETPEFIFRQHSDIRHLNYFDIFLTEGETDKILKALEKHSIPTEVLRGLKRNEDFNVTIGNVRIFQKVAYDENGSISIEKFEIYKDGELIYEWIPYNEDEYDYDDMDFKSDEDYVPEYKFVAPKEPPPTKSGKPRKGIYIGTIISSDGETVTKEKTSRGQIVYRASNGRFTKQ